jgi:hypothetical protein
MEEAPPTSLEKVQRKWRSFETVLNMSDADFKSSRYNAMKLHDFFEIPQADIHDHGKVKHGYTLATMRSIFASAFLSRDVTIAPRHLLAGDAVCSLCWLHNKQGVVQLVVDSVGSHARGVKHQARETDARSRGTQQTMGRGAGAAVPAGAVSREDVATTLCCAHLCAGGNGAAGLPYTTVPVLMRREFLKLVNNGMRSGFPSATSIRTKEMKDGVDMVRDDIRAQLAGVPLSLGIDGGSTQLIDGRKVLAVVVQSPALEYDMLLDLKFLRAHENSRVQAQLLEEVRERYGVPKKMVKHLVADGATVNPATCTILNSEYGWDITYVRCLPHAISRFLVVLLSEFEAKYNMSSFLRNVRAYVKSGGGSARKIALIEYALTLSSIDFADTRWEGLVKAIIYMMRNQTDAELLKAEAVLKEAAAAGDESAVAALEEPGPKQLHWDVTYEFLESTTDAALDGSAVAATLESLLAYNVDACNFAAFLLVSQVLDSVPAVFKMIQGGPQWVARLVDPKVCADDGIEAAGFPTAARAARELLASIRALDTDAARGALIEELAAQVRAHQEELLQRDIVRGALVLEAGVTLDQMLDETRPAWRYATNRKVAVTTAEKTLRAALKAVDKSDALKHLEETLRELEISDRFNLNVPPEPIDFDEVVSKLGADPKTQWGQKQQLHFAWTEHAARWKQPVSPLLPLQQFNYWSTMAGSAPADGGGGAAAAGAGSGSGSLFGCLGLGRTVRPTHNAGSERVFSVATDVDDPKRRSMGELTFFNTMFLRCNQRVVAKLVDKEAATYQEKLHVSAAREGDAAKRRRASETAALAAMRSGGGGGAAGAAGGGAGGDGSDAGEAEMDFDDVT